MKSVFVTVGTTQFDPLIEMIHEPDVVEALKSHDIEHIVVQYGRGRRPPSAQAYDDTGTYTHHGMSYKMYRFTDSIGQDIRYSHFVISHGGAGTIIECLRSGRPLIVVTNEQLMGNHQMELATALERRFHLISTTCRDLASTIRAFNPSSLVPLPDSSRNLATFIECFGEATGISPSPCKSI
eukprot:gb/GECG01004329.1/.p1 GENE.gb/GECG01004329.1/~~gb/GECG01004329.1/.p1  ORF type:complete len:182 (+),score=15.57 gb/GECG01004329.1/:1-546(+)